MKRATWEGEKHYNKPDNNFFCAHNMRRRLLLPLLFPYVIQSLRVGVQTPLDGGFLQKYWLPTFETITDGTSNDNTTRASFDSVDMVAVQKDDQIYDIVKDLDLMYGSPSLMNCLTFSDGFSALASIVQFERNMSSTVVGGIIFARADSNIFHIKDLRGKRIAFPQISYQVSCQAQWAAMLDAGVDLIKDTEFALLTGTYVDTIFAVETGLVDVGFLRSGQLEGFTNVPYSNFRIINPINTSYQWPTSVQPQPTSVLMASPKLSPADKSEIMQSLLSIERNSDPAKLGNYTLWFPPQNYIPLFQDEVKLGVIRGFQNKRESRCIRNDNIYDFVNCPDGTVKKIRKCNIKVPPTYTCVTNPCVKHRRVNRAVVWGPILAGTSSMALTAVLLFVLLHQQRHLMQRCDEKQLHISTDVVGQSSLAPVYKATYYETPIVVKTVTFIKEGGAKIQHINKQMRQAAILTHKNIVPLMGTAKVSNRIVVLMPYRWSTLYDLLYNKLVPISKYQQVGIMLDVVCALNFLHSNRVYGRRLMSAHLMVDDSWNVQLGTSFSQHDLSWVCAPELNKNNMPTEHSDIYHLGMLFYEVLHRTLPTRRLHTHEGGHTPDLRGRSDPIHNLIRSCWAVDPKQRPTMYDVEQVLVSCQYGSLADEYVQDRAKNKDLLKQRLPHTVSKQIQNDHLVAPVTHESIGMLSMRLGSLAIDCSPADIVHLHSAVKQAVEDVAARNNVVMLRTTDYSLMLVAALHMPQQDYVERIVQTAIDIQKAIKNLVVKIGKHDIVPAVSIGVHAGKVTARVLGRSPPIYCLLGKDVVTTCCLQETCEVNRMQLSYATVRKLKDVPEDVHLQMHHITDYSPHLPLLTTVLLSSRSSNFSKSVPSGMRL